MNLAEARLRAEHFRAELEPFCQRIEIAGSIRRRKPDGIHDVELVCISKPQGRLNFGELPVPQLLKHLDELRAVGTVLPRRNKLGRNIAWGEKERAATWDGTAVDIFVTNSARWGVILLLRTGPAEFNKCLVTSETMGGRVPTGYYFEGGELWRAVAHTVDGKPERIPTSEESAVFRTLGLPWMDPWERTAEKLRLT